MTYFNVEIVNIDQSKIPLKKYSACIPSFTVQVILIPGIESPFKNLGLLHDWGKSK